MFRVITEPLGSLNVPLIVTNHVYDVIGSWMPEKTMGGGSGLFYSASTILYLSKSKDRDLKDKKVINGIIVKAKTEKSRFTHAFKTVETNINFTKGLDRYHGLADLAIKYDIFNC
jgi:RecA/RadA recombinase